MKIGDKVRFRYFGYEPWRDGEFVGEATLRDGESVAESVYLVQAGGRYSTIKVVHTANWGDVGVHPVANWEPVEGDYTKDPAGRWERIDVHSVPGEYRYNVDMQGWEKLCPSK
jgi:hypothetical protein